MTNTIENKAKFFAQYYNQNVLIGYSGKHFVINTHHLSEDYLGYDKELDAISYLELTPLSQISDEDAIEVAKIIDRDGLIDIESNDAILKMHISFSRKFILFKETLMRDFETVKIVVDYLRSKGYALPYMGLSVEKQIDYGWVKLKE